MTTDGQVKILMKALSSGKLSQALASAKAGMSQNTARKYRRLQLPPSQLALPHNWRTRVDPFACVWDEVDTWLTREEGLDAKTLFEHLQEKYPGKFEYGQLRSLQRRVKSWRATKGADKEVFFDQVHHPGDIGASDFSHADRLGVTIAGQPFPHMVYHFVLTYSNWEFAQVCFSESLQSLSEGLQAALWNLGGAPKRHRTDSLSAAVRDNGKSDERREDFTDRYNALTKHYGMDPEHIQPASPNENGDVEQSHFRFLTRIDQALMIRGSREFANREEYQQFLRRHCEKANRQRQERFSQERERLRDLPSRVYDASRKLVAPVSPGSTIRVLNNAYSLPSRLIGERVQVIVRSETIDVSYGQTVIACMPRIRGKKGYLVDYRHIIDSLVRKPGAFDNYIYQPALFPTSRFRRAYDALIQVRPVKGKKEYLRILQLAARSGQAGVEAAICHLQDSGLPMSERAVVAQVERSQAPQTAQPVAVAPVDLAAYDCLLQAPQIALSAEVTYA